MQKDLQPLWTDVAGQRLFCFTHRGQNFLVRDTLRAAQVDSLISPLERLAERQKDIAVEQEQMELQRRAVLSRRQTLEQRMEEAVQQRIRIQDFVNQIANALNNSQSLTPAARTALEGRRPVMEQLKQDADRAEYDAQREFAECGASMRRLSASQDSLYRIQHVLARQNDRELRRTGSWIRALMLPLIGTDVVVRVP
jgi:septal ring factor EnvC (AmiA/AmiB activator)